MPLYPYVCLGWCSSSVPIFMLLSLTSHIIPHFCWTKRRRNDVLTANISQAIMGAVRQKSQSLTLSLSIVELAYISQGEIFHAETSGVNPTHLDACVSIGDITHRIWGLCCSIAQVLERFWNAKIMDCKRIIFYWHGVFMHINNLYDNSVTRNKRHRCLDALLSHLSDWNKLDLCLTAI